MERYSHVLHRLYSHRLSMHKKLEVFLPHSYFNCNGQSYPLLLMNDGQDSNAFQLKETLAALYGQNTISEVIVVAIEANKRLHEYGVAGEPDYANRGDLAGLYTAFILEELIPFLHSKYPVSSQKLAHAIAGCSLGGLSAFDIAWQTEGTFGNVGVFSGSFWWRRHSNNDNLASIDRIMHELVLKTTKKEGVRFWFEVGTEDEKEDRNNSGIIDAIEDTLDLIAAMETLGHKKGEDIAYLEIVGGQHNHYTWAACLPQFLEWAFGKQQFFANR